jgi:hypothetical protein
VSDLARQVVEGFGPNWVAAEVAHLYPNDITRVRLNIRGQRGEALLGNTQWVLHEGDWVIAFGPHPKSRLWLILGYLGSVNPGDWFSGDGSTLPDPTTGQGPIPGFRPPIDADTLWYEARRSGDEEERSRALIPRPAGGDEYPGANDHYVRVIAGQPDPDEMTLGVPGDGLPASYGPFSAIGDRIQITKGLPNILKPRAYCITADQAASQGDPVIYKAPMMLNEHPLQIEDPLVGIGMRYCGAPNPNGALEFGTHQLNSQAEGIELTIDYRLDEDYPNHRLYYLRFSPILSDMFFCVGVFNGQAAVGIGREILDGMPYPYPAGGVLSSGGNTTPSSATWFDIRPWAMYRIDKLTDRDGSGIGEIVFNWFQFNVKYWAVTDPTHGDCAYIRVSDGRTAKGAKKWKTYFVYGQMFGGYAPSDLYGYGADGKGFLYGPLLINDRAYPFIEPRLPGVLRGHKGEIAHHMRAWAGDPLPDGSGIYAEPPGDTLPDALFVWLSKNRVMMLNGPVISVGDGGAPGEYWSQILNKPYSAISHGDLSDLDADDHEQYPTVARLPQFIEDAEITADDIPAGETNGYVTDAERAAWDAGSQTAPDQVNLTTQVTGSTQTFTAPAAFVPGSLRVWLNAMELRNGRDFHEVDAQSFEIDLRVPVATSPKDVVRVAYQTAS